MGCAFFRRVRAKGALVDASSSAEYGQLSTRRQFGSRSPSTLLQLARAFAGPFRRDVISRTYIIAAFWIPIPGNTVELDARLRELWSRTRADLDLSSIVRTVI